MNDLMGDGRFDYRAPLVHSLYTYCENHIFDFENNSLSDCPTGMCSGGLHVEGCDSSV